MEGGKLLTSSVVTEELPALCPAQPSDQAGPQGDTPYCPEKCKQDACVIVVPTMSFYTSSGKIISEVAARLGGVGAVGGGPKVSRQPYQGHYGSDRLAGTRLFGVLYLCSPFSITSDRPGRPRVLRSNSILLWISDVRSQTEALLGFHIDPWITER